MLYTVHTCVLSSCVGLRIPILFFPNNAQIWQLYFVPGLRHWSDILYMDPSTPPHIRELDVLVTYRLTD